MRDDDPRFLEIQFEDGPQRFDIEELRRPAPPPDEWTDLCAVCSREYVPKQGGVCPACAAQYREAMSWFPSDS